MEMRKNMKTADFSNNLKIFFKKHHNDKVIDFLNIHHIKFVTLQKTKLGSISERQISNFKQRQKKQEPSWQEKHESAIN